MMRIYTQRLLLLFAFLVSFSARAFNVGTQGSFIYKVRNIHLLTDAHIQILKQHLHIQIHGDFCIIDAQYDLKNMGEAKVVSFGFPVDYITETEKVKGWQDDYVLYFLMEEGRNRLPIRQQFKENAYRAAAWGKEETSVSTKLYITDMFLEPHQTKHLTVRYKIKSSFPDADHTRSLFASYSERRVTYDLAATGYWQEGLVRNFALSVDARELTQGESKIKISGLHGMANAEGFHTWKSTAIDLKKARPLEIVYDDSPLRLSDFIKAARISKDKIKLVTSSSHLRPTTLSGDLFDGDFTTSWAGRIHKSHLTHEWIEVELEKNTNVRAVAIVNGMTASKEAYYESGRVKKIKIEVTAVKNTEAEGGREIVETQVVDLPRKDYSPVDEVNFSDMISVLLNYDQNPVVIKKLRMMVLEVEAGHKNTQVCISEVFILGK